MIDLALNNLYLLGAAIVIGILTARLVFPKKQPPPGADKEDESQT